MNTRDQIIPELEQMRDLFLGCSRGTSFNPENFGKRAILEYNEELSYDLANIRKAWEEISLEEAEEMVSSYKKRYITWIRDWLHKKERIVSWMISGRGNYPYARQEKIRKSESKCYQDFRSWRAHVLSREIQRARRKQAGGDPLQEATNALDKAVSVQDFMVRANKFIRSKDEQGFRMLQAIKTPWILSDEWEALNTPDYAGRVGYPPFRLQNNLALIKRLQAKVKCLQELSDMKQEEQETGKREDTVRNGGNDNKGTQRDRN